MIVDREHENHREIKSIGRCEVVQGSCENGNRRRIHQARHDKGY
ncbi:unnamed protein product [Callosobruchus maculatus]|uniref:Uncharacterized protein n=1 Tax=Callosobruchus maculatus TaxID=64391 RepID=A0A653DMR9_CALMS|nr:unnamed protein product [Callosobruchus maculatus]